MQTAEDEDVMQILVKFIQQNRAAYEKTGQMKFLSEFQVILSHQHPVDETAQPSSAG